MTCESCIEKDRIISELIKRIEELEQQVRELKSYIWKPKIQTVKPLKLGPPENHEPNNRPIPKHIDETKKLSLKRCPECNGKLSKPIRVRKRYTEDIRQPEPYNTEYHIPYYYCRKCKRQVSPKPADAIPKCRFGIKLMLLTTYLRYGMLMPLNKISNLLKACYGISISEGCIVDSLSRFAEYAGSEFERIKQKVRELAVVNIDETGWRINGRNVWLWDFIGEELALLLIRNSRGKDVLSEVIGDDYNGVVVSDCLYTYRNLACRQQKCWAHVLRRTKSIGNKEGVLLHRRLKRMVELGKSGKFSESHMLKMLDKVLGIKYADYRCTAVINTLRKDREHWFTYVSVPALSSNNNAAEIGLRQSVVMRKITGGNRSEKGARNHEVIMSVMQTWNKEGRDFFEEAYKIVQENLR